MIRDVLIHSVSLLIDGRRAAPASVVVSLSLDHDGYVLMI